MGGGTNDIRDSHTRTGIKSKQKIGKKTETRFCLYKALTSATFLDKSIGGAGENFEFPVPYWRSSSNSGTLSGFRAVFPAWRANLMIVGSLEVVVDQSFLLFDLFFLLTRLLSNAISIVRLSCNKMCASREEKG